MDHHEQMPTENQSDQIPNSTRPTEKRSLPKGRTGRKDKRSRTRPNGDIVVRLNDDDRALLRLLDKHRLLDARQLFAALGGGHKERSFSRRLEHLFHAKGGSVVDRPSAQFQPGSPSRPYVYAVGPGGRRELDRLDGIVRTGRRDISNENERLRHFFIQHQLATSEVALAFQLAAQRQGWTFELALEHEVAAASGLPPIIDVRLRDGTESLPLRPDFYFAIEADGSRSRYLVEVDLGTEPQIRWNVKTSSILRKMLAYWQMRFWNPRPIDGVIFVTTTTRRLEGMVDVVRQVDPKAKGAHFISFTLLNRCRIVDYDGLFYTPSFRSSKIGYENPRPFFLSECGRCQQLVDPANEPHEILNSDPRLVLAPATTPLAELMPSDPVYAHTSCPGLQRQT